MKTISIFGATGSIGASALDLLEGMRDTYAIEVLSGHLNIENLIVLALHWRPKMVVSGDASMCAALRDALPAEIEVAAGREALIEAASRPVDIVLNAVIGAAGLAVSLAAAGQDAAKRLALANKESLVCGGALLKAACQASGCELIPVDSEHSAIFQCLEGQDRAGLERIILTASGGPFRNHSPAQMRAVTLADALQHPNWDMGAGITIDSASMFNKALEMIEAHELFDIEPNKIDVVIHPQSIVHSLVEFADGGQLAQLGVPDMRHAIGYALNYPRRGAVAVPKLDLTAQPLEFHDPDIRRFPAIRLAREAMAAGGAYAIVLNATKEEAQRRFVSGEIDFVDMAAIVEDVMAKGDWNSQPSHLDAVEAVDARARRMAEISTARA